MKRMMLRRSLQSARQVVLAHALSRGQVEAGGIAVEFGQRLRGFEQRPLSATSGPSPCLAFGLLWALDSTDRSPSKISSDRRATQTGHPTEASQARQLELRLTPTMCWCTRPVAVLPSTRLSDRSASPPGRSLLAASEKHNPPGSVRSMRVSAWRQWSAGQVSEPWNRSLSPSPTAHSAARPAAGQPV